MGTIVGVAALFGALILIGIVCGIVEERKLRRNRRAGEKPPEPQRPAARVVISQRVPSAMETLRGKPCGGSCRSAPPPRRMR